MSNREIRFRESFRGYNRDDVTAYIEQLNFLFARKEADLRAHIADLEAKLAAATAQSPIHTEEEWNGVQTALASANEEISRLKIELESRPVPTSNDEEAEKSKLYDTMSAQVGNIIITANANADKIISDAKSEADRLRREADVYASAVKTEADRIKGEVISGVNEKVRAFALECSAEYSQIIGESNTRFNEIAENIKNRSESLKYCLEQKTKELENRLKAGCEEKTEG